MQVLIPIMLSGLYNMGVFGLLYLTTVILNIGPWQWTWTSKLSLKQTPSFIPIKAFSLSHRNHLAWYNQVMVVINAEIYLRFNQWQRNDWKNAWTWVSYLQLLPISCGLISLHSLFCVKAGIWIFWSVCIMLRKFICLFLHWTFLSMPYFTWYCIPLIDLYWPHKSIW